jgi:hypothetical protein
MEKRFVIDHLFSRDYNVSLYEQIGMKTWIDESERIATFPLWNQSGQLVGYQQYRPEGDKTQCNDRDVGRYYTYAKDNLAIWGLETLHFQPNVLFITEGVFDACKLHSVLLPAVAVLANNPRRLRSWIMSQPRTIIAICDNDKAGRELGKCADISLTVPIPFKDLGEMELRTILNWLASEGIT